VGDVVDKRSVRIFLTEKGLEKKEIARQTVKTFNQKVREVIPEAELNVFFKVIAQINTLIEGKEVYKV
jgi:DNA-binding MarR family transcriptional regulator